MSDSGEMERVNSMFFTENGKTYYGNKGSLFGDFTLKIVGEMVRRKSKVSGQYVFTCGEMKRDKHFARTIVLDVNAFDSKQRFIESLRIAYGSGTFFLGNKVSTSVVQSFYTYLKEDYELNEIAREYMEPECMGHQGDNYWIISNEVHVRNGNIVGESDLGYIVTDDTLLPYQLEIEERLLNGQYLKRSLKRFYSMSIGFGQNTVAFQLATAFTVGRIVRNALASKDVWTESNVGMIFSETKSVGKSLSLLILGLGQGIPQRVHMMFLSGGNQMMCGTSTKKIQESLSRTTGIVMIDDPTISKIFSEFLLQVQGGLLSGSSREGMSAPKAAVLMTSNSEELPRLIGRVVRFNYSGPVSDRPAYNKDLLYNHLLPFMEENKGILMAWAMKYMNFWKESAKGSIEIIQKIMEECMAGLIPDGQDRWTKGLATVVLADTLMRLSIGENGMTKQMVRYIVEQTVQQQRISTTCIMDKIERNVQMKIDDSREHTLGWLNPTVTIKNKVGTRVKAVAIAQSVVDSFPDVSHAEFKEEYSQLVEKTEPIGVYFTKAKEVTLVDLAKRQNASQKRAYRWPFDAFTEYTEQCIKYACGLRAEPPHKQEDEANYDILGHYELTEQQGDTLDELERQIEEDFEEWKSNLNERNGSGDENHEVEDNEVENVKEVLSPNTKKRFDKLTPKKRKVFTQGLQYGIKLSKKEGEPSSQILPNSKTNTLEEQNEGPKCSNAKSATNTATRGNEETCTKRLFVDGAVGVLPRMTEDSTDSTMQQDSGAGTSGGSMKDPYIYCLCKEERDSEEEDMMLICESKNPEECPGKGYFHQQCIKLKKIPEGKWLCKQCKSKRGKRNSRKSK